MTDRVDRGVLLSALCPKYLHSNSTSHTWPFGAIAELIDNACDPDVRAKHFWIDKTVVKGQDCLSFMDDGNGLDHETMHKMLSFGYSDKIAFNGQEPIGIYGNGFKSGSMRLGKDAIVFSKSENGSCVGMLSQTYLEKIEAKQIMVPIVGFQRVSTNKLSVKEEHKASLRDILCYSPFKTQEELLVETNAINSSSTGRTGTRIIIWNLRRTSTGTTEFDFEKDRYDIRIPSDIYEAMNKSSKKPGVLSYIPESVYSLRAYCSILYLKPRMQIIIRGQMAKSQLIAKSLAYTRKDHYKPNFLNKRIPITFGYNTKSKDQYGVMMYHKNRLIKAYERVGCQLKANNRGVGVIGVMECNFLDPTHSKQSFLESDKYRKTMTILGIKLEEYWQEIHHKRNIEDPNSLPVEDTMKRADQNWTQCDICRKWRKLPDGIDCSKLPDKWYCRMNPDPQFRSCKVQEEPEDSDDERPSYRKTYKQQERQEKKNKEKSQKDEEDRRRRQEDRMVEFYRINESLKQPLPQKPAHCPSTPTTPRSSSNTESAARAESLTISPAACSPSSNSGLPIISSVCSLSEAPLRGKRTHPETPQGTPKRPKLNGSHLSNQNSSTPVNMSPPSVTVELDDDDDDENTDDEIYILETASTPKPNVNLTKMKVEQSDVSKELQCSDAAAVGATLKMNVAGARSAAEGISRPVTPCPEMSSTTTQTQVHKVKQEKEDQNQPEVEKAGQSCKKSSDVAINISSEHRVIKEESSSQNHAGPSSQDDNNKYSQLNHPRVIKTQNQLEDFVRVMQATLQEGVPLKKNEILTLNLELKDVQSRLQGLSEITVKQEYSHQATQTEEAEEYKDYKTLFEKAKQKVDELISDKESLRTSSETKPGASSRGDMDEIALQVDSLLCELDQRNKERDELQAKLNKIEEERANLASQCEDLRLRLQQQRENKQGGKTSPDRATASSVNTESEEAGGPAALSKSLIGLRHNIGRLLIRSIPALDLGQVNFECNVIDEILEQFLSNQLKDLDTNT